jgi:hypothetical protein
VEPAGVVEGDVVHARRGHGRHDRASRVGVEALNDLNVVEVGAAADLDVAGVV